MHLQILIVTCIHLIFIWICKFYFCLLTFFSFSGFCLFKNSHIALCACHGGKGFYNTKRKTKNKDAYITYISLGKQIMI